MPFLDLQSGLRVAFTDRGEGPVLVFVHGWSFGAELVVALPSEVTGGRRIIAPELRGHGASSVTRNGVAPDGGSSKLLWVGSEGEVEAQPGAFCLEDLAGDLAGLLEALDVREITLAGWSLGAQVVLAALPRLRPRVARLVLLSATPCFTLRDGWAHGLPDAALAALARRVARDPARAIERFSEGMFVEGELDPDGRARAAAIRASIPPPHVRAALAGLAVLGATDLRPALAGVDLPTLVVHGERDPICPAGAGRFLAAAIPRARLALVPGAGHAPFLSRPREVSASLRAFMEAA